MSHRQKIYEDSGKIFFEGKDPGTIIHFFKDELLLNRKPVEIQGKGVINNRISEKAHILLQDLDISTTFIRSLNMREQLHSVGETLPVSIKVQNYTDLEFERDYGVEAGTKLPTPILELYGPTINNEKKVILPEHAEIFGWIMPEEFFILQTVSKRINDILFGFLKAAGYELVSLNLEFTRIYFDEFEPPILSFSGEISPETCGIKPINGDFVENTVEKIKAFYQNVAVGFHIIRG